jgi:hypothetical protein
MIIYHFSSKYCNCFLAKKCPPFVSLKREHSLIWPYEIAGMSFFSDNFLVEPDIRYPALPDIRPDIRYPAFRLAGYPVSGI